MDHFQCRFQQFQCVDALFRLNRVRCGKPAPQQRGQRYRLPLQLRLIGLLKIQPEQCRTPSANVLRDRILQCATGQIAVDHLPRRPVSLLQNFGRKRDLQHACILSTDSAIQRERRYGVHFRSTDGVAFLCSRNRILSMQTKKQRYACIHCDRNILVMQYTEYDMPLIHCSSCRSVLLIATA